MAGSSSAESHLVMSSSGTERGGMEAHQVDSGQNYITVIPVEYARSRVYPQPSEYLVEPYNDYLRDRNRDDYIRADFSINSDSKFDDVGLLYTVSQRFDREKPHLNIAGGYVERERDWERALQSHTGSTDASQQVKENTVATNLELQVGEPQKSLQNALKSLKLCVYLMSRIVVHMDLEDGPNTTVQDLVQSLLQEEQLSLPRVAASIFTIWMCSGLLELQLKPYHKPYEVRQKWPMFLSKYSIASESRMERDEPVLSFQRNVFFSKRDEEKIKDQKLLDLLYDEARYNILEGRYPCELSHYIMLGGIQARIELGPYIPQVHTTQFFREQQDKFLPAHVSRSNWSWLRISGKNSPEVRLLEQFKRIPTSTTVRKLVRKYLEFCWSLPYYGAAFFQGQVEQPVRGLTSLITHQDMSVLIAINAQGVYVIDNVQCTLLLGLKYEELSWDFAKPSQEDNPDCLPCLFLQFMVLENGTRVSKILQVFSKQAVMMDALISVFVEEMKMKAVAYADETDRPIYDTSTDSDDTQMPLTMVNRRELPQSCLSNKLSKLTLATFDEDGRCIGQMGSWSFSY
ncbi:putative FERM domain-containing protein FRMD8P1 isoform X2 [Anabrus simplex]|uniref:putative FERM domain-containing protein FRMD8P1 isoform X2 n=1 Tax=Anabrus simplex TaxID=316456 RepID=UPI0035A30A36